jgi:zinc transport system ATP-binding protein
LVVVGKHVIQASGLCFSYGSQCVLENATFEIAQRDFVSIVGPNGGGKTTLLKLFLGLLDASAGTLEVFGTTPIRARRRVGYMAQYSAWDAQFPVSALDVVLMGRLGPGGFGFYRKADVSIAQEALANVGMADLARRPFSALSGGQRQRVLIARALACEPELLLLDEPTANLDPRFQDDLYELLKRVNERMAVVLVSHDVGFVPQLVRTVVCVNRTVSVHASSGLTGDTIVELYGQDVRMVHHHHEHGDHHH